MAGPATACPQGFSFDGAISPPQVGPAGRKVVVPYPAPPLGLGSITPLVVSPTPPPPPPPSGTPSPIGASVPPLTQLVDKNGAVWTLVNKVVKMGTVNMTFYSDTDKLYVTSGNQIGVHSPTHGFACWTGTAWTGSGC